MQIRDDQRRKHRRQRPRDRAAGLLQKHRRDRDQHTGQLNASSGRVCSNHRRAYYGIYSGDGDDFLGRCLQSDGGRFNHVKRLVIIGAVIGFLV